MLLVSFCVLRKKGLDCHKVHKWWLSFLVDLSLYLSPGIKLPLQRSMACANVQYLQAMVHGMTSKPPQALNKWKEEQPNKTDRCMIQYSKRSFSLVWFTFLKHVNGHVQEHHSPHKMQHCGGEWDHLYPERSPLPRAAADIQPPPDYYSQLIIHIKQTPSAWKYPALWNISHFTLYLNTWALRIGLSWSQNVDISVSFVQCRSDTYSLVKTQCINIKLDYKKPIWFPFRACTEMLNMHIIKMEIVASIDVH